MLIALPQKLIKKIFGITLEQEFIYTIYSQILNLICILLTLTLTTRLLTVSEFGDLNFITATISNLLLILTLGVTLGNNTFIPRERVDETITINVFTIGFLIISHISGYIILSFYNIKFLYIYVIFSFLFILDAVLESILLGYKEFKIRNLLINFKSGLILLGLLYFYLSGNSLNLKNYFELSLFVILGVVVFKIIYISRKKIKKTFKWGVDSEFLKPYIKFIVKGTAINIIGILLLKSNILLVKYYLTAEELGIYAFSIQLATFAVLITSFITPILLPKVNTFNSIYNSARFNIRVVKSYFIATCISALFIGIFSYWIILLVGGEKYLVSTPYIIILLIALCCLSISSGLGSFFQSRNYPIRILYYAIIAFCVNLILNIVFLNKYGIIVAAISSLISYLLLSILNLKFFYGYIRENSQASIRHLDIGN